MDHTVKLFCSATAVGLKQPVEYKSPTTVQLMSLFEPLENPRKTMTHKKFGHVLVESYPIDY